MQEINIKSMNTFPENEIKGVNSLLHKLLGTGIIDVCGEEIGGEEILTEKKDNKIYTIEEDQTLNLLKKCSDQIYLKVYKILNFYYPRWISYNAIQKSDDRYKEFSSNNELLIALTSIIDWLANVNKERSGWTHRFVSFLKKNLSEEEVKTFVDLTANPKYLVIADPCSKGEIFFKISTPLTHINNIRGKSKVDKSCVKDENGKNKKLKTIEEFAKYLYEVRSLVIHTAELGGMYPFNISFNLANNKASNIVSMIQPKDFRKLLWKSIFNSLDLRIIY